MDIKTKASPKVFFQGLNELRAIAALGVILSHIELYKFQLKEKSLYQIGWVKKYLSHLGENCVYFFFVLSGFLITYLLYEEILKKGKINIKFFYLRRVLRIWPLYFTLAVICFIIVPQTGGVEFFSYEKKFQARIIKMDYSINHLLHILFFLTTVSPSKFGYITGFAQSWSVSIEEQFYLFFPMFILLARNSLWKAVVFMLVFKAAMLYLWTESFIPKTSSTLRWFIVFLMKFQIDKLAVGCFGGIVYYHLQEYIQTFIRHNKYFVLILLGSLLIVYFSNPLYVCIISLLLIYTAIAINFKNSLLNTLGIYSYGIYMYHPLVMYLTFAFAHQYFDINTMSYNFFIYVFIFSVSILISSLSYKYLEKPFIDLKKKFN